MVKLKGIADTIKMLDKLGIDAEYDEVSNVYEISDDDYAYMLDSVKNKKYVENLKLGTGRNLKNSSRRHATLAGTEAGPSEIVFTPAAILDLLAQIEEFKEFDLGLTEGLDGTLQLQVGDSLYELAADESVEDVDIPEEAIEEISTINEEAYSNLLDDGLATTEEEIESGLIKEALKTLLVGGVVRLGKKLLTD